MTMNCLKCGEELRKGWYHACGLNLTSVPALDPPTVCKGSCRSTYWGRHPDIACTILPPVPQYVTEYASQLNGKMVPEDQQPPFTTLRNYSTYQRVAELVRRGESRVVQVRTEARADTEARLKSGKDYCANPETYHSEWDEP